MPVVFNKAWLLHARAFYTMKEFENFEILHKKFFYAYHEQQRTFSNKESIINTIYNLGIQSVIVEGGSKTLQFFIDNNYWDCIRVFKTSKELKKGTPRPNFKIRDTDYKMIEDDKLYELFKN